MSMCILVAMQISMSLPGSAMGPHASARTAGGRGLIRLDPAIQPAAPNNSDATASTTIQRVRRAEPGSNGGSNTGSGTANSADTGRRTKAGA